MQEGPDLLAFLYSPVFEDFGHSFLKKGHTGSLWQTTSPAKGGCEKRSPPSLLSLCWRCSGCLSLPGPSPSSAALPCTSSPSHRAPTAVPERPQSTCAGWVLRGLRRCRGEPKPPEMWLVPGSCRPGRGWWEGMYNLPSPPSRLWKQQCRPCCTCDDGVRQMCLAPLAGGTSFLPKVADFYRERDLGFGSLGNLRAEVSA